jgi:predicted RNase H-like HicB family nuclease
MAKLTKLQIEKVNELRKLFPSKLNVSICRIEDGTFLAEIKSLYGIRTEGNNFSELIEMVNDAVKTYFEVPRKLLPYMPNYVPSIRAAQKLDVFPVRSVKENLTLPLAN